MVRDAHSLLALDIRDEAADLAGADVDEAMAGFAMEPVTMGGLPRDVISLRPVLGAVENEGFQVPATLEVMEGAVDGSLVAGSR